MQTFEALCMLIALRVWSHTWKTSRSTIAVRSDNTATLSMVTKMQPKSATLGILAREMAIDVANAIYEPSVVSHLPGVANQTADQLSRRFQPGVVYVVPPVCKNAQELFPPARNKAWWVTLH